MIICFVLIAKQLILCGYCKENLHADNEWLGLKRSKHHIKDRSVIHIITVLCCLKLSTVSWWRSEQFRTHKYCVLPFTINWNLEHYFVYTQSVILSFTYFCSECFERWYCRFLG